MGRGPPPAVSFPVSSSPFAAIAGEEKKEAMEAAPSAKPGREPPPVPPNYISLRHLQQLRLKEKEEQERRLREEEAAAAAKREAEEEAAAAAAAKREAEEAALKAEAKGRATSREASGGAKERHRGRKAQGHGQGHQWVAVAHRAPATTARLMAGGQGAAGNREAAIGGGAGEKGVDDVPDNAPYGRGKPWVMGKWKGREKEERAEAAPAPSHGGKPAEVVPASPYGGEPENKSESKAKGKVPGNQAAESGSGGGRVEPADAAILSSRGCFRRGRREGAGGRSTETCTGVAPVKTDGPSPPRGVKSDGMGKPKPPAPGRKDAVAGGDSPDGKKAGPGQAPPTSAADGSSKPTSGGEIRKTMEAKPGKLVEGQHRQQVVEAQAVAERNPRGARCSAGGPRRGRGNDAAEQHGRVWVPKAAAAGSSAGAGL